MSKILFFICLPLLLGCVQFLGLLLALLLKLLPFRRSKQQRNEEKIGKKIPIWMKRRFITYVCQGKNLHHELLLTSLERQLTSSVLRLLSLIWRQWKAFCMGLTWRELISCKWQVGREVKLLS